MNWHVLGFIWTRSLFLANYVVIGAIAVFGSHGVTWRDMVILAKSRQVARHLPDVRRGKRVNVCQHQQNQTFIFSTI